MNIQKISFQQFNSVNFTGDKKKKSSLAESTSALKIQKENRDSISITMVGGKVNQDKINNYIKTSKKELKNAERKAYFHKLGCIFILNRAKKDEYKHMMHVGKYNVNFGVVDKESGLPSSINFWKNGHFVKQYNINSIEPLSLEIYDCENKDGVIKEYAMADDSLVMYKESHPDENSVNLIVPMLDGFYRTEGTYNKSEETLYKKKELSYHYDMKNSTYFEYNEKDFQGYKYDVEKKSWIKVPQKKRNTITFVS